MKEKTNGPETLLRTDDVMVRVMPLGPGESTPPHRHTEVTDTMVCLTGRIRILLPGSSPDAVELAPGQRRQVPPGTVHAVAEAAGARSEYLLIQGVGKYDFVKV